MTKIFSDEFFLACQTIGLDFKGMVKLTSEVALEATREDWAAEAANRKILDKIAKSRKVERK